MRAAGWSFFRCDAAIELTEADEARGHAQLAEVQRGSQGLSAAQRRQRAVMIQLDVDAAREVVARAVRRQVEVKERKHQALQQVEAKRKAVADLEQQITEAAEEEEPAQ